MSYPVNQNISPYQKQQLQQLQQQPAMGFNTPQLQNIDTQKVKQDVNTTIENQNNLVTQATEHDNPGLLVGLTVPIWLGISRVMEKFNKACADSVGGKKNLLEKVRDFGDNIGQRLEGPQFKKASEAATKAKGTWQNFVSKVPVLNAFFNTPAKPKNTMASMMRGGTLNETAQDAKELIEGFIKNADGKTYNQANLKELGLTIEEFEKITRAPHEHIDRIIQICEKRAKTCKTKNIPDFLQLSTVNTGGAPWLKNPVKKFIGEKPYNFLFGREVRWSECTNKLKALKGLKGNYGKTAVGKALPKMFLRVMEGLTNGTAGGKMAIAMQAYCFADAIIRTAKAKKGDKGKTFAESIVNDLSYYLLMPLGLGIMYGLGGLKYIGMDKAGVDKYRDAVTAFNKKAAASGFANKAEYKQAKKALNEMLQGTTKLRPKVDGAGKTGLKMITNIIHKPLKAAASAIMVGLDSIQGYMPRATKTIGNTISRGFKNLGYNLKRAAGYPTRFGLYMFLIAPPLVKLVVKGCHLIFGKPEKSLLDEDKENKEAEKREQYPPLVYPDYGQTIAATTAAGQTQPTQPASVMQPTQQDTKLGYNQPHNNTNQTRMIPTEDKPNRRRYIPSDEGIKVASEQNLLNIYNTQNNEKGMIPTDNKSTRRYIPSDEAVKVNKDYSQDDKVSSALSKAAQAEKLANRFLGH